nr:MAG TPA: hypothetical protein [Caudoviricetes sp.]
METKLFIFHTLKQTRILYNAVVNNFKLWTS